MAEQTLDTGSYSCGTMRVQDLIPKFIGALRFIGATLPDPCSKHGFDGDGTCEECSYLLNEDIWDAMNEHCPECYHFSSHEGDGADYGVWHVGCDNCDEFEDCEKDHKQED